MSENSFEQIEDVLWSVTDKCNLNCIYCAAADGKARHANTEMSPYQVERILSQLRLLKNLRSIILSGGEALLSRNLSYILEQSQKLCRNVFVITNGTTLFSPNEESLFFYRPTLMVTIDSSQESINRLTRGPGILKQALSTLERVRAKGLTTVIICVVTKFNIDTIVEDIKYFNRLGHTNFLLQQLHCEGNARELYENLSPVPAKINDLYQRLLELEELIPELKIDYNEICFYPMRQKVLAAKCDPTLEYNPQRLFMCGAGYKFFALKTNGDVIPCNALRHCKLGNIFEEDVQDIFALSTELSKLRKLRGFRVDILPGCADCEYSPICDGGCRADVFNQSNNIFAKHPYCDRQDNSNKKITHRRIDEVL